MKLQKSLPYSFLLILFFSLNTAAQEVLSLEQAFEIALERNYNIRIVKNQEQIAGNNYTRGNAGLLPSLDLRSQFSGNINNANQNLRDGGEVELRGIHNTAFNTALQGSWMLFDGFRGQIRYRQLEELNSLSELNTRISFENLAGRLASDYYFYIQQVRLLTNLQYAVDLSKERVRIEEEHFLLGSGSKVQLLQAQVNLNADSSRLERQYEVLSATRIRINELMALPDLSETFVPADTSITVRKDLIFDELEKDVMNQNASILAALHNRHISEYDLDIIRSRTYPYLSLSSGYGFTNNTYQSGGMVDQQSWGMNYGLTVGINIFNGHNQRRQIQNARIELENRDLSVDRVKQETTASLLTIYNAYTNNLRLLDLEVQNLEVARENLDIAFERYRLGALSGFELRGLQQNLLEAEERMLSIQYQAKMAEISLLQMSGRILDNI